MTSQPSEPRDGVTRLSSSRIQIRRRRRTVGTSTTIGVFLASLSVFGCDTRTATNHESCTSQAECSLGFECIDGICESAQGTRGAASPSDAGRGFSFDSGRVRVDAGPAQPDAGQAMIDATAVDASMPEDASDVDGGTSAPDARVEPDAGICGVAACVLRGAECGEVVDECGAVIDCGRRCPDGQLCGAVGTPFENRCRCERRICQPNQCGTLSDGCGGTIECPGCTSPGHSCSPQNQCVCTRRRTCAEAGAACGDIADGCGGTRNCGGCTAPDRCGARVANQCGNCDPTRSPSLIFGSAQNSDTGGPAWESLSSATQEDRQGAVVRFRPSTTSGCSPSTSVSDTLVVFNAGADVPRGAKITGFSVFLYLAKTGGSIDLEEVYLARNNSFRSGSKSVDLGGLRDNDYDRYDFGGENDMWGLSQSEVTPAMLSTASFSVRLRLRGPRECEGGTTTRGFVDFARVIVHYEPC